MRKVISAAAVSFALAAGAAFAQAQQPAGQPQVPKAEQPVPASMTLPKPGEEVRSLAPAFGRSMTWRETVPAGAMGPGSKETTAKARADCRTISGGFGYSCPVEMVMGQGKEALRYTGELIIGYDDASKEFRAFNVFNDGNAIPMVGKLEGKKLTLETTTDVLEMGKLVRGRLTFDLTDPNAVKFTESHKEAGGDWVVAGESIMRPVQPSRARRSPSNR